MNIRSLSTMLAMLALAIASPVFAQDPPKPAPAPKPEAKVEVKVPTAASLADNWSVAIDANGQSMEAALVLKADAKDLKKITGTITSPQGEAELEGEVVAGKLTFWFKMNGGSGDM